MPIDIVCPECNKTLRVPDEAAGKRVRCPNCQATAGVPAARAYEDFDVVDDGGGPPSSSGSQVFGPKSSSGSNTFRVKPSAGSKTVAPRSAVLVKGGSASHKPLTSTAAPVKTGKPVARRTADEDDDENDHDHSPGSARHTEAAGWKRASIGLLIRFCTATVLLMAMPVAFCWSGSLGLFNFVTDPSTGRPSFGTMGPGGVLFVMVSIVFGVVSAVAEVMAVGLMISLPAKSGARQYIIAHLVFAIASPVVVAVITGVTFYALGALARANYMPADALARVGIIIGVFAFLQAVAGGLGAAVVGTFLRYLGTIASRLGRPGLDQATGTIQMMVVAAVALGVLLTAVNLLLSYAQTEPAVIGLVATGGGSLIFLSLLGAYIWTLVVIFLVRGAVEKRITRLLREG